MLARISVALLLLCCAVRAPAADLAPSEYLDERTGATITVVHEPLVFALERSILAANARDYVSLTAVEVDRSGRIEVYLIGYVWSTIDRRTHGVQADLIRKPLELSADGRLVRLVSAAQFPKDLLDEQRLLAPKASRLERAAYPASRELLRYIAASKHLSLSFALESSDGDAESDAALDAEREVYEPWGAGQKALQAFAEHTSSFQ